MLSSRIFILLILPIGIGCSTASSRKGDVALYPCSDYRAALGPNHQCTQIDGGALDEFEIRREFTSRVISEGTFLPHKEYGRSILVFNQDGSYEARKLHFTQYWTHIEGRKTFLVYAEDSRGRFEVAANGTLTLDEPDESTCRDRKSGSSETLAAHLRYAPRREPFRAIKGRETLVAFTTDGWLKDFHGYEDWQGEALFRADVQWPPFPEDKEKPRLFRFQGFDARIHYGCLNRGFQEFIGNDQIYLAEQFRYDAGVDPWRLKPGTRLRATP